VFVFALNPMYKWVKCLPVQSFRYLCGRCRTNGRATRQYGDQFQLE